MHTRRHRTNPAVSRLTLDALEPRSLFSVAPSLAQLIRLNTPNHSNPNAGATPLLIVPAGTVIPVDSAPFTLDLNASINLLAPNLPVATYSPPLDATGSLNNPFPVMTVPTGIIVKYTFFGDANLNEQMTGSGTISNAPAENSGMLNLSAGTLFLNSPTQAASGTLTINGSNVLSNGLITLGAGSSSTLSNSGTGYVVGGLFEVATKDATQVLNVADFIPSTTYSFGIVNGKLTVITPTDPLPSDPTTIPTSITDNHDATTQIAIPTTL